MTEGTWGRGEPAGGEDAHGEQEPKDESSAVANGPGTPSPSVTEKKSCKITRKPFSHVKGIRVCRLKGTCLGGKNLAKDGS